MEAISIHAVIFLTLGTLAGGIASFVCLHKDYGFSPVGNLIIGGVGALLGGFLFHSLVKQQPNLWGEVVLATFGAACLLYATRFVKK